MTKRRPITITSSETSDAWLAARAVHATSPVASVSVAKELRNALQPLRIYADRNREVVAIIGRLAKLAECLEGH